MDWSSIIVGAFALIGTVAGSWLGVRKANQLVEFRLKSLEDKVMLHNNLVERMMAAERDLKTAFRLIDGKEDKR